MYSATTAQRRHEIQFQFSHFSNGGTSFFTYHEDSEIKHKFEFDHKFSAVAYVLGWNYPINGHLEIGSYLSTTFESRLKLREAESAVFNSEGRALRPDTLFSENTAFDSDIHSIGVNMRVNLLRFGKFKCYLNGALSYNLLFAMNDDAAIVQATHPDLRQALIANYVIKENWMNIALGFGLSYALKYGFSLRPLEIYGNRPLTSVTNLSETMSNLEFRTGISYQFYTRK